jgi:hypothetical protein
LAIKHLPDGEDFGSHPDHFPSSFGYSGSASKGAPAKAAPMARHRQPSAPPAAPPMGGDAGEMTMGHAHGGHIEHCAHGGYIVHHPGGMKTHHHADGSMMADDEGGEHDADEAEDKAMVAKGIHEHEAHDHKGEQQTDLHLARGGHAHPRLPRDMTPAAGRGHSSIGAGMRKPSKGIQMPRSSPASQTEGGPMGFGVNPSEEPDIGGGGAPTMKNGGRFKR